jgi:hypothetical protein
MKREVVWSRSPDVAFVDDGQRILLLPLWDPGTSRPQLLTGPAASIWRTLNMPANAGHISRQVAEEFGGEATVISEQVDLFLRHLADARLIVAA